MTGNNIVFLKTFLWRFLEEAIRHLFFKTFIQFEHLKFSNNLIALQIVVSYCSVKQ